MSTSGDGGDGIGGMATIDLADGEFSLSLVSLEAVGTGGDSGDPGSGFAGSEGGFGTGGFTRFALVDDAGPSGLRALDSLTLDSTGNGGTGSTFAWSGTSGEIDVTVSVLDADSALDLTGTLSAFANGFGGGDPTVGIDVLISGAPFNVGSSIQIYGGGGITVTAQEPFRAGLDITLSGLAVTTTGLVESGGPMFVNGQLGINAERLISGQETSLLAFGGPIAVGDLLSAGPVTASGQSIDIHSSGGLNFAQADATAGPILIETEDDLGLTTANATGAITLSSASGSIAGTGAVIAGGAFSATAPEGVSFTTLTSGATTLLDSENGEIDIDTLVSPGLVSATGRGVFIDGSGPLSFATAVSTGEMAITASGNLAFASVNSDLTLTLTSTTGSITATGDVRGGFPTLTAAGSILIEGDLNSLGTLAVNAGGSFVVEGDTGADDAQIIADQGITMTSLQTGEITRLDAANGNILIPELRTGGRVTARGNDVNITSSGGLLFDEARAFLEDVRITVADDLSIGEVFASNEIILNAGSVFALSGTARGFSIDVTSADIALGGESRLGLRDATSDVTLRNGQPESSTYVGGNGGPSETWSLSQGEATRISADESITILADGNVTIDDLALSFGAGGANIGAGGLLEISSPENIRIIGDVALRTSGPDDTFRIDPRLIALNTDTGSISMFTGEGGGGTPQGRLELIADRIVAATGANIAQLETMTDLDAITTLLGQPGGTGEPLSAGTIHLEVIDSLFIQNSGTSNAFADRRGFVANALTIGTESSPTQIAINGRILTQGGAATGLDTAPLVSINGTAAAAGGSFHPRSSINGCVIGADCAFVPPEPEQPELDLPTSEDVESPLPTGEGEGSLFVAPLIELAGTEPLITPPLVDEPITGVGNDDLWEPNCEPGEEDGACPADDGQP